MRNAIRKKRALLVLAAPLVAALAYALLSLTVEPPPVLASSCNCGSATGQAEEFCFTHFGDSRLRSFTCPVSNNEYEFQCEGDPGGIVYLEPCP